MRMGQGVEWALHVLLALAWADDDAPVPAAKLAACHDLPVAYLNKHLQSLARAGILESTPGVRGGFRLARAPESITVMDVVSAIEGTQEMFRCTEIRQSGVGAQLPRSSFDAPCAIHSSMRRAELAWRRELASQTIADLRMEVDRYAPTASAATLRALGRDDARDSPMSGSTSPLIARHPRRMTGL